MYTVTVLVAPVAYFLVISRTHHIGWRRVGVRCAVCSSDVSKSFVKIDIYFANELVLLSFHLDQQPILSAAAAS